MARTLVRPARPDDAAVIVSLIRDLAIYEREPASVVKITEEIVRRDGFGDRPRFEVLLAELDGEVVGFALIFPNYSTWEGRAGIYIEDLFVRDAARGHGLGRRLLVAIAKVALERGCARVDLNVLDWNPTREFYHRIGINHLSAWLPYRMTSATIAALAAASE